MEFDGGIPRKKAESEAGRDAAKTFLNWLDGILPTKEQRQKFESVGWGVKKSVRFLFNEQELARNMQGIEGNE